MAASVNPHPAVDLNHNLPPHSFSSQQDLSHPQEQEDVSAPPPPAYNVDADHAEAIADADKDNADSDHTEGIGDVGQEDEEEPGECPFCLFMKAGPCRDNFIQWEDCVQNAEEAKEDIVEKCHQITFLLKECMEANADYYEPVLQAEKAMEEAALEEQETAAQHGHNSGPDAPPSQEDHTNHESVEEQGATASYHKQSSSPDALPSQEGHTNLDERSSADLTYAAISKIDEHSNSDVRPHAEDLKNAHDKIYEAVQNGSGSTMAEHMQHSYQ